MVLPWFIPHLREVEDYPEEEDALLAKILSDKNETSSVDERSINTNASVTVGRSTNIKGHDEATISERVVSEFCDEVIIGDRPVKIKEYRDEANRPWYKFFDEYEYRETTEEAKKFKPWQWFHEGTSAEEKKLLLKLDITLAFTTFLGYWIKYIDSANLNNAYISGMKEDLGMKGNDLINTQVIFLVGNIIFELPWLFLLPRVSLNYCLFGFEVLWSLFTLFTAFTPSASGLKAFRFFVGSCEAVFFPVAHFCQPLWYKSDEIGRRLGFMYFGQFLGVLVSGLIASGAIQLAPVHISGWRFMFIIDFVASLSVAFITFFCHPGTPQKCYSIWLTDDEIRLARKRIKSTQVDVNPTLNSFFDKATWKKILTSWHFWLLSVMQMMGFNTNSASSGSFGLWLKSLNRYSIPHVNQLTSIPPALGILWIFIVCWGADFTRKRFGMIFFSFVMNFVSNIILAIWDVPESAKWAGFLLAYYSWSQSSVFNPLISDLLRHDQNQRAIEWMIIYILGLQSSAWIGRLTFPTVDQPRYPKGFSSCAGFSVAFNLLLIVAYFLYKRDERNAALSNGIYLYNSKNGEIPGEVKLARALDHSSQSDDTKQNNAFNEEELDSSSRNS